MPERELIYAVIQKAVEDAMVDPHSFNKEHLRMEAQRLKDNAIAWLASKDKKFGSFLWYCHLVDFSPDPIWKVLKLR